MLCHAEQLSSAKKTLRLLAPLSTSRTRGGHAAAFWAFVDSPFGRNRQSRATRLFPMDYTPSRSVSQFHEVYRFGYAENVPKESVTWASMREYVPGLLINACFILAAGLLGVSITAIFWSYTTRRDFTKKLSHSGQSVPTHVCCRRKQHESDACAGALQTIRRTLVCEWLT